LSKLRSRVWLPIFLITHSAEPTMKVNSNNQLCSSKKNFDSSINEEKIQKKERHTQVYAQTYQQKSYILAKLLCCDHYKLSKVYYSFSVVLKACLIYYRSGKAVGGISANGGRDVLTGVIECS